MVPQYVYIHRLTSVLSSPSRPVLLAPPPQFLTLSCGSTEVGKHCLMTCILTCEMIRALSCCQYDPQWLSQCFNWLSEYPTFDEEKTALWFGKIHRRSNLGMSCVWCVLKVADLFSYVGEARNSNQRHSVVLLLQFFFWFCYAPVRAASSPSCPSLLLSGWVTARWECKIFAESPNHSHGPFIKIRDLPWST